MTDTETKTLTPKGPLRRAMSDLADDFWYDGPTPVFWYRFMSQLQKMKQTLVDSSRRDRNLSPEELAERRRKLLEETHLWTGSRFDVMEAMWGKGQCLPGGETMIDSLVVALGLTAEMNVLDLAAGLGSVGRRLTQNQHIYVTGLEADPDMSERGMEISRDMGLGQRAPVSYFVPREYQAEKRYHCVVGRELFYRIERKDLFIAEVSKSMFLEGKLRGQIVFTDYVLEDKDRAKPSVASWLASEKNVFPTSADAMSKMLTKNGLDVRVTEDLTAKYRRAIFRGFSDLGTFLQSHTPSPQTKMLVLAEMNFWAVRVAAMKQGLKLYRFYAIKA